MGLLDPALQGPEISVPGRRPHAGLGGLSLSRARRGLRTTVSPRLFPLRRFPLPGASPFLLALALAGMLASPEEARPQAETRVGVFSELWTDPHPDSGVPPSVDFFLLEEDGVWLHLEVDDATFRDAGGPMALLGRSVAASGYLLAGPGAPGEAVRGGGKRSFRALTLEPLSPAPAPGSLSPVPQTTLRYVTVLCRFPESTDDDSRTPEVYRAWMGDLPPGMGHYWNELSAGLLRFHSEAVAGWYELPQPLDHYFQDPDPSQRLNPDWGLLAQDCAGTADADVDFSSVDGVNLQFNVNFGAAWGGSGDLALDGPTRRFAVTWMPAWAGQSVYGHEIGHTLGLPHSSGPYRQTYDSQWDVMSSSYVNWDSQFATHIGQHTIIYHRDLLGWVSQERTITADWFGDTETVRLESWGSIDGPGWDLVEIPLSDESFYTVEARRLEGYDMGIPAAGVILHHVDPYRWDRKAQVIDPDGDGDPNDEGAVWTVGETFRDEMNGVSLTILQAFGGSSEGGSAEGYLLGVTRGWWVEVQISGDGWVRSQGPGLECSESCNELFPTPGTLSLEAVPAEGAVFGGWGGACSGLGACQVTLGSSGPVLAEFVEPLEIPSQARRPSATVGASYNDQLAASGGSGAYAWSLTGGSFPSGLSLDSSLGAVKGIPEEAGEFEFQVSVSSLALTATASLLLTVEAPDLQRQKVIEALLIGGPALNWDQRRYLDIVGNRNGRFDLGDVVIFLGRNGG